MRLAIGLLAAGTLVSCAGRAATGAGSAPRVTIRAARLLDLASGSSQPDMVVLVEGQRIAEVLPARDYRPRASDRRIDLGDGTLLPGLIDAHVHLSIGGPAQVAAATTVRAGFTTVVDLGAVSQRIQAVRDSIAAGALEGPRVLAAGLWIGVKGGVCEFGGIGVPGGAEAFRARVRENLAAGADLIKACVTGWPAVAWLHPDSAEMPSTTLAALTDEARRGGRRVVAHALSREGVRRALDAGVAGLVHAAYLDEALIRRMQQREVWLIPTLASLTAGDTSAPAQALVEAVRQAHRAGVTLVYGTDGGVLPHGQNAREARALQAAGIPAADILRAATVSAARALGIADSVGAIRRGMSADLIVVPGDPLQDLSALQRPNFVMARGRVVLGGVTSVQAPRSGNPILPGWYADPEAHVFAGRYWIYPTYSAPYEQQTFLDAFSSRDLITWEKHPRVLEVNNVAWAHRAVWAPSLIEKDGWYYLFFGANDIQSDKETGGIGVARSRRPEGPFIDYLGKPLIAQFHNGAQPIDQFVFRDGDGAYYIVYGGWRHCNIARLNEDFTGFVPFPDGSTFKEITPAGYVEGAFMLRKDGKYYFMWSEGGWTGPNYAVAYAIGASALGPFERVGKILQQDSTVATGAGHHSVLHSPASNKWYIVYHRRPLGETDRNHRVVSIEELRFDERGFIQPVKLTTSGVPADSPPRYD